MGFLEKIQLGFKAINERLGVDEQDEKGYRELVSDSGEMKILEKYERETEKLAEDQEWPIPRIRNRKATKPDTESDIRNVSKAKQKESERDDR